MWQAEHVKQLIEELDTHATCELVPMTTSGDILLDSSRQSQGGKGLFIKDLERALVDDHADIAVHSMKDVPIHLEPNMALQSVGERADVHDVLVSDQKLDALPAHTTIGTSSNRRRALLAHIYKRTTTIPVRGNVQTRLRKLDDGEVDALVLAEAGLSRLGLHDRKRTFLPKEAFVPAVGQGVLAVEYRNDRHDLKQTLGSVHVHAVEEAVRAERLVAELLEADCAAAFGALCEMTRDHYTVRAVVLAESGEHAIYARSTNTDALIAAERVAGYLLKQGAETLLRTA